MLYSMQSILTLRIRFRKDAVIKNVAETNRWIEPEVSWILAENAGHGENNKKYAFILKLNLIQDKSVPK